jgi:3-oxoacyl-[acyl-carrier-protein] synthase-3
MSADEIKKFTEATGVEERRIADENICISDLCYHTDEKLISELNWNKEDIEILVFISQTADFILPNTSTILQDRLGIYQNCIAFDVPLGCSEYVFGMSIIAGIMKTTSLKRGIACRRYKQQITFSSR